MVLGRRGLLGFAVALVGGCVAHVPLAGDYTGPRPLPESREGTLATEPQVVASDEESLRYRPHFTVRRLAAPSAQEGRPTIEFEFYEPQTETPTEIETGTGTEQRGPLVVLLPIFNGQLSITRYFARYFVNRGWSAIVVDRDRDLLQELDHLNEAVRANIADYRRVLDWAEEQPQVDASRIGLFGISFGAMDAVMLMALDHRIKALVAAMAGGDFPDVVMSTAYRPVSRTVDEMLEDTGLTRAALRMQFEQRLTTDPLRLAPYVDAEHVLLILTRADSIVPFPAQEALRRRMGSPESLYLPTGHRTSVLFFPRLRVQAYEFFARQFGETPVGGD
jgi:dienelactone hydrolase